MSVCVCVCVCKHMHVCMWFVHVFMQVKHVYAIVGMYACNVSIMHTYAYNIKEHLASQVVLAGISMPSCAPPCARLPFSASKFMLCLYTADAALKTNWSTLKTHAGSDSILSSTLVIPSPSLSLSLQQSRSVLRHPWLFLFTQPVSASLHTFHLTGAKETAVHAKGSALCSVCVSELHACTACIV